LKYVHIDSRERLRHETKGKFNVSLGHGFSDCSRVALKSLSIPNSFGNMHLKTMKWFEIVDSSAPGAPQRAYQAAIFEASIYEGEVEDYIDNGELQTLVQSAYEPSKVLTRYMVYADGSIGPGELITERRVFEGQTYTPTVAIQYDTNTYKFTITPTGQANRNHYFGLLVSENSIFQSMGYEFVLMNNRAQVSEFLNTIQNNAFQPTFNNNTAKLDYVTYMKNIRSNKLNKFLKADHVFMTRNMVSLQKFI
jgi:archaellum component FlaG (FlaF/FlaG flagellin family)